MVNAPHSRRPAVLAWCLLVAAVLLCGGVGRACAATTQAVPGRGADEVGAVPDIKGPIGPMAFPEEPPSPWIRRLPGGLLAAAFAAVALGFVHRRRRRAARLRGPAVSLSGPVPGDDLLDLPADEFYGRLLGAVRTALASLGEPGTALTPRELAETSSRVVIP